MKKRGTNRHAFGRGPIQIDQRAVVPYLEATEQEQLPIATFKLVNSPPTDP